jgi:uncharacterized protein with FMN-binding domain
MKTLIILGCIAVPIGALAFYIFHGMGRIKRLVIHDVDLSKVPDGTYEGHYHRARWTYDVRVTVKKHRITEIKNTNQKMERSSPSTNGKIVDAIMKKQSIAIDVVSMATINTRAFQAAARDALNAGVRR